MQVTLKIIMLIIFSYKFVKTNGFHALQFPVSVSPLKMAAVPASTCPKSFRPVSSQQTFQFLVTLHLAPHTKHERFYLAFIVSSHYPEETVFTPVRAPGVGTNLQFM